MEWIKTIEEAAKEVLNDLGTNYKEASYEEALMHEFRLRNIPYERQRNVEIMYKGHTVGMRTPDCIINPKWNSIGGDEFLVEIKAVANLNKKFILQTQVYLSSLNIPKGALLNFNTKNDLVEIREVDNPNHEPANVKISQISNDLEKALLQSGQLVMSYLGSEFFYYSKDIYINSVAIELRNAGFRFHSESYPVLYKNHMIASYGYDYVFDGGEVVKILSYKKEGEIDAHVDEMESYNKLFDIPVGYILALPENDDEVIVKKVSI